MAHTILNQTMDYQFQAKGHDTQGQTHLRGAYRNLYYNIDNLPNGPEKSVACRKLLESLDAALRCEQY